MKLTQKSINEIARQSKCCHREGLGLVVNVFTDGDCIVSASENDTIARGDGRGGWDYRAALIRTPMTRAEVREHFNA